MERTGLMSDVGTRYCNKNEEDKRNVTGKNIESIPQERGWS